MFGLSPITIACILFVLFFLRMPKTAITLLIVFFIIPFHIFAWMMFTSYFSITFTVVTMIVCDVLGLFGGYILQRKI